MKTYEPPKSAATPKPQTLPQGFTIKVFEGPPNTSQSVKIKEYLPEPSFKEDNAPVVNKLFMTDSA